MWRGVMVKRVLEDTGKRARAAGCLQRACEAHPKPDARQQGGRSRRVTRREATRSEADQSRVVCCVKFSNDGQFLATGCNRTAQIYNVKTGGKVWYVFPFPSLVDR